MITGTKVYDKLNKKIKTFADCESVKQRIFFIINESDRKRASFAEIKEKYMNNFPITSSGLDGDMNKVEKNMLKALSKHSEVFDKTHSKPIYSSRN